MNYKLLNIYIFQNNDNANVDNVDLIYINSRFRIHYLVIF